MTSRISKAESAAEWATYTQLTTSSTAFNTVTAFEVFPYTVMRFETSCSGTGAAVTVNIKASFDGGSTYDQTVTSVADHASTTAAAVKSITTRYSHVQILARNSTSSTGVAGTAQVKFFGAR